MLGVCLTDSVLQKFIHTLVYDILLSTEEGAGKRCSECEPAVVAAFGNGNGSANVAPTIVFERTKKGHR